METDESVIEGLTEDQVPEVAGHEVILFTVGQEGFALPLEDIAEIHKFEAITPIPMVPPFLSGVINVHGNLASVVSLSRVLEIEDAGEGGLLILLVAEKGGIALQVDETLGFDRYTFLEDVTREATGQDQKVLFMEGVFRSGEKLISLINPDKLRIWIDGEFVKGDR